MSEIHLRQANAFNAFKDLNIVLVDHLLKTKEEYINLKKNEIQDIFIKIN